jgi:hypothetical protein
MSATTKLENRLLRLSEHHNLQYKESASISDAVETLHTQAAKIEALQAEVEMLRKDAAWQPIETAPKDHFPRLYMVEGRCVQGFVDVTGMFCTQTDYQPWRKMYGAPTHWRPLPQPPIAGEAT